MSFGAGLEDPEFDAEHVERVARMMALEGGHMEFKINRSDEANERDGPGRTFSRESVDALNSEVALWIGTRLMRRMRDEPEGVMSTLTVRVDVGIE